MLEKIWQLFISSSGRTAWDRDCKMISAEFLSTGEVSNKGREPWYSGYGRIGVVGSNPNTVYWMDIFHIYLLLKL